MSRQSVHAWLARYRDEGPPGLEDRSHKVHQHSWQIPAELEAAVCELRRAHRKWGPKRLVLEMGRRGLGTVTRSTVYRVMIRNQLIEPRSRRRRRQDSRTGGERPVPMQLWQLDVTASTLSLANRREVKIVTGIDDHSRYCVIARAVLRATARPVCRAFVEAMTIYGVPEEVLTDNGTVFTGRFIDPRPAEVLFERICRENGITQRLTEGTVADDHGQDRAAAPVAAARAAGRARPVRVPGSAAGRTGCIARGCRTPTGRSQSLGMAFPASRFTPAVSPLPLRVPSQLIAASTRQAEQPEPPSAELSAAPAPDGQQAPPVAVEADRVVPPSGNLTNWRAAGLARPGAGGPEGHHLGG